jgi:GDP-L-fucose synthase
MRVLLTGGNGMLGRAIKRAIDRQDTGWTVITPPSCELDLRDAVAVEKFFANENFDLVIHAAARVGGIKANMDDQSGFMTDNLLMNTHTIRSAQKRGIKNLINLGSSCMYPRDYRQPLVEEDVLAAPLEPTNEGYAIAKIAAARLCAYLSDQYDVNYRTFIPCNLYGPGDYFHPQKSHLIPAVILKIHNAMVSGSDTVEIWGDGTVRREVLFIDDLADFIVSSAPRLADLPSLLNLGRDHDYTVNEIYADIAAALGWKGRFTHKLDAPMGMTRKLMSSAKAKEYGWNPQTSLETGAKKAYEIFLSEKPRMN